MTQFNRLENISSDLYRWGRDIYVRKVCNWLSFATLNGNQKSGEIGGKLDKRVKFNKCFFSVLHFIAMIVFIVQLTSILQIKVYSLYQYRCIFFFKHMDHLWFNKDLSIEVKKQQKMYRFKSPLKYVWY